MCCRRPTCAKHRSEFCCSCSVNQNRLNVQSRDRTFRPEFAVVIPACDEEECIGRGIDEITSIIDRERFVIAVGVNDSVDKTAEVARKHGAVVAETMLRGYGYGCQSAIDLVTVTYPSVHAYIFVSGDGATDPRDIGRLVAAYEQGYAFVLCARAGR